MSLLRTAAPRPSVVITSQRGTSFSAIFEQSVQVLLQRELDSATTVQGGMDVIQRRRIAPVMNLKETRVVSFCVRTYDPLPSVTDAPETMFDSGNLWLLEQIDGSLLRFQLQSSGVIQFGDERRVFGDQTAVPESLQFGAKHVCERLDRTALSRAVDDVEEVVFFSVATHRRDIEYDWDRLPPVVGIDIWSETRGFLPPDVVETIYQRLGIEPVNAFERELSTRDFDPESYSIPESAWYDGPAAGVVIRNKRGGRAKLEHQTVFESAESPPRMSVAEVIETYVTTDLCTTMADECRAHNEPVTVENLYERVFERVVRAAHPQLFGSRSVDLEAFKSELAAEIQAFMDASGGR